MPLAPRYGSARMERATCRQSVAGPRASCCGRPGRWDCPALRSSTSGPRWWWTTHGRRRCCRTMQPASSAPAGCTATPPRPHAPRTAPLQRAMCTELPGCAGPMTNPKGTLRAIQCATTCVRGGGNGDTLTGAISSMCMYRPAGGLPCVCVQIASKPRRKGKAADSFDCLSLCNPDRYGNVESTPAEEVARSQTRRTSPSRPAAMPLPALTTMSSMSLTAMWRRPSLCARQLCATLALKRHARVQKRASVPALQALP